MQLQTREAYRDAIVDAAEQVFCRCGYRDAKMNDIAEQAGVSVGTLYNYFSSKEDVFDSLFERGRTRFFDLVERPHETSDPVDRLRATLERTFGFIEENGAAFSMYLRLELSVARQDEGLESVACTDYRTRYTALLQRLLSQAVEAGQARGDLEPRVLAQALFSLMNGLLYQWLAIPNSGLTCHIPKLLRLFFEGARPQ